MSIQTILITGASSGIGKAAARYFADKGWNVAATMRRPEKETELGQLPNVKLYALDVTSATSIATAIDQVLADYGQLDVLVNNAGYGAVGIFEKATTEQIQKQFDTNVFGVMNVIRAVLPHMRSRRKGTIINVTSMGGLLTFPLYSVYHATKWALEGFGESLHYELRPFGIKVKNVEPGPIKTDFYDRSMDVFENPAITEYDSYQETVLKNSNETGNTAEGPEVVAKVIYQAATDGSSRIRYAAGSKGKMILGLRKWFPLNTFFAIMRSQVEKGFKGI